MQQFDLVRLLLPHLWRPYFFKHKLCVVSDDCEPYTLAMGLWLCANYKYTAFDQPHKVFVREKETGRIWNEGVTPSLDRKNRNN